MNIATALNRKYINYTIVMLTSLCINNPMHIDAYLLHCELTADDIQKIKYSLDDYDISIIPLKVDRQLFSDKLPVNDKWTVEALFRLLLPDLLPKSVERILYLDVDLIVNHDISDLYEMPLGDNALAGACDRNGKEFVFEFMSGKEKEAFEPLIKSGYKYFNSGVLLLNINWLKTNTSFENYTEVMKNWDYNISAIDQDLLNYIFNKKVIYIPWQKYNLFVHLAYNDGMTKDEAVRASILHFAGSKPWCTNDLHYEMEAVWWEYAEKSKISEELMSDYIRRMTYDKTIEIFFKQQSEQLSYQEKTIKEQQKVIEEQKKSLDDLVSTAKKLLKSVK